MGAPQKEKNPGALGTCPVCPLVKTALTRALHDVTSAGVCQSTMQTAFLSVWLDYCNSILYGTSSSNLNKLQHVQNALARTVMMTKKRDHITPVLTRLHWLPVCTAYTHQCLRMYPVSPKTYPFYFFEQLRQKLTL